EFVRSVAGLLDNRGKCFPLEVLVVVGDVTRSSGLPGCCFWQVGLNPFAETDRNEHTRRSIICTSLKFFRTLLSVRLVKRSRALVETNPTRNNQSETHRDDDSGGRLRAASFRLLHRIERSPYASENLSLQLRRQPQV